MVTDFAIQIPLWVALPLLLLLGLGAWKLVMWVLACLR
jgi:hypothetical protein